MVVKSIPSFYSKDSKFMRGKVKIAIDEPFILTGRGSFGDQDLNPLAFYWKLVRGKPPEIVDVQEDGRTVKLKSPREPTEIEFELKVVDTYTNNFDSKSIVISVYEYL